MIVSIGRCDKTTLHVMATGPKAVAHIHQTSPLLCILDSPHLCPVLLLVLTCFPGGCPKPFFFCQNSCLQCFYWVPCMHAKTVPSCPTLCDPVDCSPPGSPVHGVLQARMLEWVALPPSRGLPNPEIEPMSLTSPALTSVFFTTSATWETLLWGYDCYIPIYNSGHWWHPLNSSHSLPGPH